MEIDVKYYCILLCTIFAKVYSDILVLNSANKTILSLVSQQASFGNRVEVDGIRGRGVIIEPQQGCTRNITPAPCDNPNINYIAIIKRHNCTFYEKVYNAEKANYTAAIIYNVDSDSVITMQGSDEKFSVHISSVFTGGSSFKKLSQYLTSNYSIWIIPDEQHPASDYVLLPFAIILPLSAMSLLGILMAKLVTSYGGCCRECWRRHWVKKLPTKRFKKGDRYEVCAVCLEDYVVFDKLRILPCSHAFHQKCIDPWLMQNKRTCPLCNKRVHSDDSDEHVVNGETFSEISSERTPLIGSSGSLEAPPIASSSTVPPALLRFLDDEMMTSQGSARSSSSRFESSAEVHAPNLPLAGVGDNARDGDGGVWLGEGAREGEEDGGDGGRGSDGGENGGGGLSHGGEGGGGGAENGDRDGGDRADGVFVVIV